MMYVMKRVCPLRRVLMEDFASVLTPSAQSPLSRSLPRFHTETATTDLGIGSPSLITHIGSSCRASLQRREARRRLPGSHRQGRGRCSEPRRAAPHPLGGGCLRRGQLADDLGALFDRAGRVEALGQDLGRQPEGVWRKEYLGVARPDQNPRGNRDLTDPLPADQGAALARAEDGYTVISALPERISTPEVTEISRIHSQRTRVRRSPGPKTDTP